MLIFDLIFFGFVFFLGSCLVIVGFLLNPVVILLGLAFIFLSIKGMKNVVSEM